jgi:xanthine dehydrogenase YagT iron-sulfur-binding subunit
LPERYSTNREVRLSVNGEAYSVQVPVGQTLLDTLRDNLALTGTKKVCDLGHCGACTVHKDGTAVLSCLTLAALCDGADIVTIEGIAPAPEQLSALQQAFIEHDGLQCGFCTPGQIMSAAALLAENSAPSEAEVREHMAGNLCRCGAYDGIVKAVLAASRSKTPEGGTE